MKSERFWSSVFSLCRRDLLVESRIHRISSFDRTDCQAFVKREDESGFGISGCKKRKYASLIPFLQKEAFDLVSLIGGINSNHIAGFSQLLIEEKIPFHLFLKKPYGNQIAGNRLITHLLTNKDQISFIENDQWENVESLAKEIFSSSKRNYVIPEGGSCLAALPGALTLLHDIIRNEQALGHEFDHIFIDSGTALIAGGLVLMNHLLKRKSQIHIVLMADDEKYFAGRLGLFQQWFYELFEEELKGKPLYHLWFPITG